MLYQNKKAETLISAYPFCTLGGNRTPTPEGTGFWIQRVYQFRHQGIGVTFSNASAKLKNIFYLSSKNTFIYPLATRINS